MTSPIILPEQRRPAVAPPPADTSILAVISRAAADPTCDIEKMERLLAMHERMQAKAAEAAFNAAMAEMQCEIPTVGHGALNEHTEKTYATLDDINTTLKPIMQTHGFAISFKVEHTGAGVSITGILMHRDGHREQTTMLLPVDIGKGRNAVQAVGSSTTYGKRYVMCALLNITTSEMRDDDGQGAGEINTDAAQQLLVPDILDRVASAPNPEALTEVWKVAVVELRSANDKQGYEQVKAAVVAKGKQLEAAA
ncbi:ERF family protein [Pseudomonas japonica]|uniref:ERF superfamily protein n=1 Tax=Pseudomonas japonica TaxID=256466 RepID=A0A239BPT5_9PSED|nr:ERF family protein [Pseudomonas japonica]SNS09689.1 ERF superfamily protein [Pseudomonas japonica]